jgi:hypothetical protein
MEILEISQLWGDKLTGLRTASDEHKSDNVRSAAVIIAEILVAIEHAAASRTRRMSSPEGGLFDPPVYARHGHELMG